MRILFMGTPDFAVATLRSLFSRGEGIIGVVTQPDKPRGRGYTLTPPPVKVYAESVGLPVYQPATLRDEAFADELRRLDPELIVVVAYGKLLPDTVLRYPRHGCINGHASLLPKYRGAAPIQRAIMEGESVTGVTAMYMNEGLDTGDMMLAETVDILPDDDFAAVHDRLAEAGARAICRAVDAIRNGSAARTVQDDTAATYAAKIEKADCAIDFTRPAEAVYNQIRALSPFPLSFTRTPDGRLLKVTAARRLPDRSDAEPGTVCALRAEADEIVVSCGDGSCVALTGVLPEGKGRMRAGDFIRGRKIAVGDLLRTQ